MAEIKATPTAVAEVTISISSSASPTAVGKPSPSPSVTVEEIIAPTALTTAPTSSPTLTPPGTALPLSTEDSSTQMPVSENTTPMSTLMVTEAPLGSDEGKAEGSTLPIVFGVLLVLLLAILAVCLQKRRRKRGYPRGNAANNNAAANIPPISIGNAQHIGSREDQQDSFAISDINDGKAMASKGLLAVIADGMGGLANGQLISNAVVKAMREGFKSAAPCASDSDMLLHLLKLALEQVKGVQKGKTNSGSTVVAALLHNRCLSFLSVGDSRICLLRNGGLLQLNREHVYGRELDDMAVNGVLSSESAQTNVQRKALTSYIGMPGNIEIDRNINPIELADGDVIVLMSDGVYGTLSDAELIALLAQEPMAAAAAVENAILNKKNIQQDNLTIVILGI